MRNLPHGTLAAAACAAFLCLPHTSAASTLGAGTSVELYIALPGSHDAELSALIRAQQTPGSPQFGHYLTPDEFGRYFGAPLPVLHRAAAALRAAGFTIERIARNRTGIDVHAPASAVGALFHAPALAGAEVSGLDPLERKHPHHRRRFSRVGNMKGWGPPDIASVYDLLPIYAQSTGKGITVADATVGLARQSDFAAFTSQFGLGATLNSVPVGSGVKTDGNGETTLDVEWIAGVAPDATVDQVSPPNASDKSFDDMYSYIVNEMSDVHIVTTSWGVCEQEMGSDLKLEERLFAQAVSEGQWWLSASGDDGSDDCGDGRQSVDYPGSSASVVSVGGTEVKPKSTGGSHYTGWKSEVTWGVKGDGASGGGRSILFAKPPFQQQFTPADGARDVPDVALMADDYDPNGAYLIYFKGRWENGWGGTSFAAPMWAGFLALLAQERGGTIASPLTRLYQLGGDASYGALYHDITSGCNAFRHVPGYCALPGYDQTTGLGSFDGANLAGAY
jgi:kumamolisin